MSSESCGAVADHYQGRRKMQPFMKLILALSLSMMQTASGVCPASIGVLDRHTTNKTHQKVMLCWKFEDSQMVQYYDIEIQCKHHGEVLTPKISLKIDGFTTVDLVANVTLRCGSYCNVSVIGIYLNGSTDNVTGSIDTVVALTPVIDKAIISTANMASLLIKSSKDLPMSCGDIQSFNVTLHEVEASLVNHKQRRSTWEWNNNGDIVLTIANISYCDPPANVSIQRQKAVVMEYQPFDAPVIIGVVVQDSNLTLVFSDKARCSNSGWEVCVTGYDQLQTEHCSIYSAEDRLLTVTAGEESVYGVRARFLFGNRQSPYSETTSLGVTSVLPKDQITLSNIGLPDVHLCYEVNLPISRKTTSVSKPKQFVVHYKLCGSMDERISNLSVTESCLDLQGWPGGHCYEVQLLLTVEIDGLEISLKTMTVQQGPVLPLIALAAIPVLTIIVGSLLCAVLARRNSVKKKKKASHHPITKIMLSRMPAWEDFWSQTSIEPDIQSEYITVGSDFDSYSNEYLDKLGSHLADANFDDFQTADSNYVYVHSTLSTSTSTCTSGSIGLNGQSIKAYNREPSLVNFSSGD